MKKSRQEKILEIIENNEVETQEELAAFLTQAGFETTQATVSRDIKELGLSKIPGKKGQKYAGSVLSGDSKAQPEKYTRVLREGFVSMEMAQSILVIKTVSGMAMAVAAALDNLKFPELVGSIAGDDTIFCAVRSSEDTNIIQKKIKNICL